MTTVCGKCGGKIKYKKVIEEEVVETNEKNLGCFSGCLLALFTGGISLFLPKYKYKNIAVCKLIGTCEKCGKKYEFYTKPDEDEMLDRCENCIHYDDFNDDNLWCDYTGDYVEIDKMICEKYERDE